MNRKITGIGEVVYDIIFKQNKPIEAKAGGSILNMLVNLRRLNLPVSLIADMVDDTVGKILHSFIQENGIDTQYIYWHGKGRSRLALAFLDEHNEAEYLFYKMQNEKLPVFTFPQINENDILIFGSYYAIKPSIRPMLDSYLEQCKNNRAILMYDPNFRKSHRNMLSEVLPFIKKNIAIATITKGSFEDFELIFETLDLQTIIQRCYESGCKHLIITNGKEPVLYTNFKDLYYYSVVPGKIISTIGAGDAFMSGLVYSICLQNLKHNDFEHLEKWTIDKMIATGLELSCRVCQSYENYISIDEMQDFEKTILDLHVKLQS